MSATHPRPRRRPRLRRRIALLVWTLFVLYPDPLLLLRAARHAWTPPVAPESVAHIAARLPADPHLIELYVTSTLVRYEVPWRSYGVPWYFPSVPEVLARGEGDCQAQAIVLASLLRAKGIPAQLVGSFDHLWVEYPDKQPNRYENAAIAIAAQRDDGEYAFRWPEINWRESWEIERAYFWDPMPGPRLWLLLGGWALIGAAPLLERSLGGMYARRRLAAWASHVATLFVR
jgi:Transglutaminase-like superfamily